MATVVYIKERRQHLSAMIGVMRYCVQDHKIWDDLSQQKLISGINCDGGNSITEFLATKTAYGKTDGINFYQYVQSFHPRENITPQQAHEIAKEFASQAWPGHEVLVTTHCDAAHIHSHFIINSVSFEDGKKLRQDPNTLKSLRQISDNICQTHGLSVLKPYKKGGQKISTREYRSASKRESWKFKLMYHIGEAMRQSGSREDFLLLMKRYGYGVIWTEDRKHITFICPNGMKCRGNRLHHSKYEKENLENELRIRKQLTAAYYVGTADSAEPKHSGCPGVRSIPANRLRNPSGVAGGGSGNASQGRKVPAGTVPAHSATSNPAGYSENAAATVSDNKIGTGSADEIYSVHPATGWEREREVFLRLFQNAVRQSPGNEVHRGKSANQYPKDRYADSGIFRDPVGAGLHSAAALAQLIDNDSENEEDRRKRIEAEQTGSNVGFVLGLAVGAAMALTQNEPKTEEQTIREEQDYNEFVAELEAEEEEYNWQQAM